MNNNSKIFGAILVKYISETKEINDIIEYAILNNDKTLINYLNEFVNSDDFNIDILDNYILEISGIVPTDSSLQKAEEHLKNKHETEKNRLASWYTHVPNIIKDAKSPEVPKSQGPVRSMIDKMGGQKVKNIVGTGLSAVGNQLNKYQKVNDAYNAFRKGIGSIGEKIGTGIKKSGGEYLKQAKSETLAGSETKPHYLINKGLDKIKFGQKIERKSRDFAKPVQRTSFSKA